MKISVSINGRFHFFDIAAQFHQRGYLQQLITSYPKFKVNEWGVPNTKIKSMVLLELMNRSGKHFGNGRKYLTLLQKKMYGKWSRMVLDNDIDIFLFFAGNGFNSKLLNDLKEKNVVTVADEGSSHVLYQNSILKEESEITGINFFKEPNKKLVDETLLEYDLSHYILVPSIFVERSFLDQGIPENKLIRIPWGVDLSHFKQVPKEDETFRIVFAGGLTLQKGVHYLLQAFHELDLPDAELWLVGGPGYGIKHFLTQYNNGKVRLKGRQPQSQLHWFYSQCDVYCQPSIQDGFAMVISQAMACGLPIICTTNTGAKDLIEEGKEGFVVPIRDVKALKEKILYLYQNPDICKKMGYAARKKIETGFTWDDFGDRFINECKRILG
ncbi:MAG: glycosyltransferase family 4 protein [Candidatus Marinimicrobia bacterium]|nr:glycosyltransferase family 4 protein [Candidatus Neomarinimicrobiota bacterium]